MTIAIAVIDDDVRILDAIELIFGFQGWNVRTYSAAESFIEDHDSLRCDCLLLDPHLPGLSGAEAARWALSHRSDIPIIVITARPGSDITREIQELGARGVLTKPVTEEELVLHVVSALKPMH